MAATPESKAQYERLSALCQNKWHALPVEETFAKLGSRPQGLSNEEVEAQRVKYGPNTTPTKAKPGLFWRIVAQIHNSVIYILLAAAIISGIFKDWPDLGLIVGVIVLNATIGLVQEGKAEAAAEALDKMMDPNATVFRNGQQQVVKSDQVVVGDVVILQAGDRIPADVRFFSASNLKVAEAALTGESEDVGKSSTALVKPDANLGDRINCGYAGTSVTAGAGQGVVFAVGPKAEVGSIKKMIDDAEATETPLQQQLEVFGRVLSIITILVAIATFFIAWKGRDNPLAESFAIAVSIAVAIIPEGLPSVVTITLALGVRKMAEHNAIVRKLPAVETLGSVSVVCSDKTGTLTLNQMMVTKIRTSHKELTCDGAGYDPYSGEVTGEQGVLRKKDPAQLERLKWLALPGIVANDGGLASADELVAMWPSQRGINVAALDNGAATNSRRLANTGSATTTGGFAAGLRVDSRPASVLSKAEKKEEDVDDEEEGAGEAEGAEGEAAKWKIAGDPTDVAVLVLGHKLGITGNINKWLRDTFVETGKVPFDSDYKFVATMQDVDTPAGRKRMVYVKGAWDEIIKRCGTQAVGDNAWASEPVDRAFWLTEASGYAANGMRVLAIAQMEVAADKAHLTLEELRDGALDTPCLQMNCLLSIVDPCRKSAKRAIRSCHKAGIRVKMITGDHADTACYISKTLGIINEKQFEHYLKVKDADPQARKHIVLRGDEIRDIPSDENESELAKYVMDVDVFARVAPEHKLRIVRALKQTHGKITSMTGDGVNDAPALKEAHVGVAMGIAGTEVAKSAAKIVLSDDLFATIAEAVRRGRGVYDNLKKILLFGLPTSFAQGFCIVVAMIIGMPSPITAMQCLTVNMLTSVTLGTVIALEEPEADVMRRPPRDPKDSLLDGLIAWRCVFVTGLLIVAMLGNFQWDVVDGFTQASARGTAMTTLVVGQCLYTLNCRFVSNTSLTYRVLLGNAWVPAAIVLNLAFQMFFLYTPAVNEVWGMEGGIGAKQWGKVILLTTAIFLIVELEKVAFPYTVGRLLKALSPVFASCSCNAACCHNVFCRVFLPSAAPAATGMPTPKLATSPTAGESPLAAAAGTSVSVGPAGASKAPVSCEYASALTMSRKLKSSRRLPHSTPLPPEEAKAFASMSRRSLSIPPGVIQTGAGVAAVAPSAATAGAPPLRVSLASTHSGHHLPTVSEAGSTPTSGDAVAVTIPVAGSTPAHGGAAAGESKALLDAAAKQ